MNQLTDHVIANAMSQYGGSFVQTLGVLFRQGDAVNQARLKVAFPEYFEQFRELAILKDPTLTCECGLLEARHRDGFDGNRLNCDEAQRRSGAA